MRRHAADRPDQPAFVSLADDPADPSILTYFQLDRRARAIASRLQDMCLVGQPVLLVYPHGLEFVMAFLGCLYAGCIAVPTSVTHHHRTGDRFQAIVADTEARLALSTSSSVTQFKARAEEVRFSQSCCRG
ncbi:MAG: AMP-binding protein [Phycisphaerae bacterium]